MDITFLALAYLKDKQATEEFIKSNYPEDYESFIYEVEAYARGFQETGMDKELERLSSLREYEEYEEDEDEEEDDEDEEEDDEERLSDSQYSYIVLSDNVCEDYIEQIVDFVLRVYGGSGVAEDDVITETLGYLGIRELSSDYGYRLSDSRMKKVVDRAVKAVTGLDIKNFKSSLGKFFNKKSKVNIFGKTYVWDPAEHPRDELGRFTFKPNKKDEKADEGKVVKTKNKQEKSPVTANLKSISELDKLDWKNLPGRNRLEGLRGVVKINGVTYNILYGVSKEDFAEAVRTNNRIKRRAKRVFGEDFEIAEQVIYSSKNFYSLKAFKRAIDLSVQIGEIYVSPHYHRIDNMVYYSTRDVKGGALEDTLVHEYVHFNMCKNNKKGSSQSVPQEVAAMFMTMKYSAEYKKTDESLIGYPLYADMMFKYAKKNGWSKKDLYEEVNKAYKTDKLEDMIVEARQSYRPFRAILHKYPSLTEYYPRWENVRNAFISKHFTKGFQIDLGPVLILAARYFVKKYFGPEFAKPIW